MRRGTEARLSQDGAFRVTASVSPWQQAALERFRPRAPECGPAVENKSGRPARVKNSDRY